MHYAELPKPALPSLTMVNEGSPASRPHMVVSAAVRKAMLIWVRAIFTFGVLMLASGPPPLWLVAILIVWAGIGSSAAVLLSVPEDLGLLISGFLGAALLPRWGYSKLPPAPAGVRT